MAGKTAFITGAARGLGKEIARALALSPRTVETHRANLFAKLGARNIYLMPTASPEPELRAFRDVVFARLRGAGLR